MISKDFKSLAREVQGRLLNREHASAVFNGVAIDSRVVRGEQLFVAIKGEKNDGHKYINDAIARNCAGLLINEDAADMNILSQRIPAVAVEDTHRAMIRLAQNFRKEWTARLIAVTGSNGKTTTKELIYSLLKARTKNTYRSPGNFNNLFGLPLSIFDMPPDTEFAVFELGISLKGEMKQLAEIAQPDLVLITNVGPTHLETLGCVENVAEEKFQLADFLASDKTVLINGDDAILRKTAARRNRNFITYGFESANDFRAEKVGLSEAGFPQIKIDGEIVEVRLFGEHQVYNILAAYCACKCLDLNVKHDDLKNLSYNFAQYRGEIENISGMTIIADCYNANPASMKSGLESFRNYLNQSGKQKRPGLVIIGDMLELGKNSKMYHAEIGQLLAGLEFEKIITVGALSEQIYKTACEAGLEKDRINYFADVDQAGAFLIGNLTRGGVIYLKASRGIGLEKLITLLRGTAFRNN